MRACSAARVVRYPYLERNMLGPTHTGCGLTHALTVQHLGADRFGTQAALLGGMPKSRRRCQRDRSTTTDVVTQLECAIKNPHAALIGALIGGLVPWFGRTLAHEAVPAAWSSDHHNLAVAMVAVVLGCACFSAISVYKFGCAAFGDARKALGFTITLEGVMLVSTGATSNVALAVLILINAVANGSVIALAREATCKRRAADQRRAATRAKNRSSRPRSQPVPVTAGPLVKVPTWSPVEDAVDAEIVSEEELYS